MSKKNNKMIHCIGDSHVGVFSGQKHRQPFYPKKSNDLIPFFKTYRLGNILAYNLCLLKTKSRGREKLFDLLKKIPKKNTILISCGEIDCRAHLGKQALLQKRDIKDIVKEYVDRYFSVILEIKKQDYNILVWNVPPSAFIPPQKSEFPAFGTCKERNLITTLFNNYLLQLLKQESIPLINIYNKLIDNQGITKPEYLQDEIHFNQKILPFIIQEINEKVGTSFKISKYQNIKIIFLRKLENIKFINEKYNPLTKKNLKKIIKKIIRKFGYKISKIKNNEVK